MNLPYPIIAREGWLYLAIAVIASLVVTFVAPWYCSLPLWLLSLFVLQFFRDPPREVPNDERAVVSPADGRVIAVERAQDPYLQRDALKVSVFMNPFNVHSNRSPVAGRVEKDWYYPGTYVNASLAKASSENERKALWIKTTDGFDIVCVQIAGLIARRILCYVHSGDSLGRGQRYGFIRFGSRVDVYLPPEVLVRARIGDKVYGAESILAEFPS